MKIAACKAPKFKAGKAPKDCKRIIDEQIKMHKRIQSDKPVVFSFSYRRRKEKKIDEIGQILKVSG